MEKKKTDVGSLIVGGVIILVIVGAFRIVYTILKFLFKNPDILVLLLCGFCIYVIIDSVYSDNHPIPKPAKKATAKTVQKHSDETKGPGKNFKSKQKHFSDNGDGTVKDNTSGLMWQRQDDGRQSNWDDAQSYCSWLNLGEHSDWRMPTKEELISIVKKGSNSPAIDTTSFPNTQSSYYWASTTDADSTTLAWIVYFGNGDIGYGSKAISNYVRCVRLGQ